MLNIIEYKFGKTKSQNEFTNFVNPIMPGCLTLQLPRKHKNHGTAN